jgi:hypothetical protein
MTNSDTKNGVLIGKVTGLVRMFTHIPLQHFRQKSPSRIWPCSYYARIVVNGKAL